MKKKILLPVAGMFGALVIILLLVFPMLSMETKDIPVGIISLDEGMVTPKGEVNAGDKFVSSMIKSDNKLIEFKKAKSEKALKQDFDNGKYYATIVVPKDFTKNFALEKPEIAVVINEGLHPMITMNLTQGLNVMQEKTGITFNITSINSISSLGIKVMLLPIAFAIMTFITSLITAFLITLNIKGTSKGKDYLKQLIYICIMAFVIGFITSGLIAIISGIDFDITKTALYITTVSIALMLLVNGSINLFGKNGIVIPLLLFILGMILVQIPYEYLSGVWQVLVASWEPFRYIGSGLREVLYQGHGIFNSATISLAIIAVIGIIFSGLNILKKEEAK